MFCPKCATQNADGARFCRSCGADVSLVPQAMTGNIPSSYTEKTRDDDNDDRGRKRGKHPSVEGGIRNIFVGVGFLAVSLALAYSPIGRTWWFWMLIPAFSMLGGGVAEYLRAKNAPQRIEGQRGDVHTPIARSPFADELPPRSTSELMAPPPSVVEGTTRHLGAEAPTKVFNQPVARPKQES